MGIDGSSNTLSPSLIFFSITNCSSGSTLTCFHTVHLIAGVITAISCLFGIPANIAVIVALSQELRGSSMSQRLFFNLALSDLLSLMCLLLYGVIFFTRLPLTNLTCHLLFYCFSFISMSSLNTRVLLSIQRYYQILHHTKWQKVTRPWQRFLLSTVWVFAALLAIPAPFSLKVIKNEDKHTDRLSCNGQTIQPVPQAIYITFVVFCHLVLLYFYRLLARGVKQLNMSDKNKKSVIKLFIRIIAACLIVGFLPLIARVVHVTAQLTASDNLFYISQKLTFIECFYFFNHCLNPVLYFFASRRQADKSANKRKGLLMALNDSF